MEAKTLPLTEFSAVLSDAWQVSFQPAGCPSCGQAFLVPAGWQGRLCPHCLQAPLEAQPARLRREPPERVLPFRCQPADLAAALKAFTHGVWLAPDDFTPAQLQQRLLPCFWPMWLVDATLQGSWQAELGFDYQVSSSHESFQSGSWRSQAVIETRVRWEPRLGEITRRYQNVAAPAVSDEAVLAAQTGASPIDAAQDYQPAMVKSSLVRIPDLEPDETWPKAQAALAQAAAADCQQAGSGQHLRGFQPQVAYQDQNWTQLLLPLYVTYYTDDQGKPVRLLINGFTGQVGGRRLSSPRKGLRWAGICLLLAAALFVLALLSYALSAQVPGLAAFSPVLWLVGFLAAGCAAIPAAWPLIWNRSQQ
jgi:hypothetical protein